MHKWISTDNGAQCYRCGVVIDWCSPDDEPTDNVGYEGLSKAAHDLVPGCTGPGVERAHQLCTWLAAGSYGLAARRVHS